MRTSKKILLYFIAPSVLLSLFYGCLPNQQQTPAVVQQPNFGQQQSDTVSKRFDESTSKNPSVVESAIQLSEKYAKLSEESAAMQQENKQLQNENARMKSELNETRTKLTQTQKELAEANDLLIDMRLELNNWKVDILGFRDEIRKANKAQLDSLLKVLEILGGEAKTVSAQNAGNDSNRVSPNESNLPPTKSK
jgi:septal ring factor EnvC (AmiA/AmiB activator)